MRLHATTVRQPLSAPSAAEGPRPVRFEPATISAPPPQQRAPVRVEPLPVTGPHPPLFAVLAAHGGAGASTLARWWAHAADTGPAWPASPRTTQRVLIAARLCMPGLIAAAERLREYHAGLAPDGVTVIGLVLSAARPGRLPAPVSRYRRTVTELVDDAVWSIRWHDELVLLDVCELADDAVWSIRWHGGGVQSLSWRDGSFGTHDLLHDRSGAGGDDAARQRAEDDLGESPGARRHLGSDLDFLCENDGVE
ncbi:hypothetical protein [Nocardia terpenica]|uniref:Uncharacterized protein n=1 Tax=Nocardia terpenica TaxID=455432 RepID=A0A164JHK6_9NOCA|nr:hypothetical protein [Nocardia terpenica]KZM70410.1 hypothetical protein AWN90_03770 [Nocardia terpenica]